MRGMFFTLSSWQLGLLVFAVIGGACVIGALAGRYVRKHSDTYREPIGAVQGALLGLVGLILAFGLSLAVGRYQDRRAEVVNDANTIGTAYLRAQTIAEPQRSDSLALLRTYTDLAIHVTREVPSSSSLAATTAEQGRLQRELWRLAGEAMNRNPQGSAPRLYVDSLNAMIDQQTVRLSGLNNRVPNPVLWVELLGRRAGPRHPRPLPVDARKGPRDGGRRGDPGVLPRARDLRPRSPDAGHDHDPVDAAGGGAGLDGAAARRPGPAVT